MPPKLLPWWVYEVKRALFVVLFASVLELDGGFVEAQRPNAQVLALLSYDPSFPTTPSILTGLEAGLSVPHDLDVEYIDAQYIWSEAYRARVTAVLRDRLRSREPYDLVLVADDPALELIRDEDLPELDAPVVAFGINHPNRLEALDPARFVAIPERVDLAGTLVLARRLQPDLEKVIFIVDGAFSASESLRLLGAELEPREYRVWSLADGVEDVRVRARALTSTSALVILGAHRNERGLRVRHVPLLESICRESGAPCYTLWKHLVTPSVVGGQVIDLHDQALFAAQLASEVLAGASPSSLRVSSSSASPRQVLQRPALARWPDMIARAPPEASSHSSVLWAALAMVALLLLCASVVGRRGSPEGLQIDEVPPERDADLATVGRVTASVAHDLNNLLQIVRGLGSLLEEGPLPEELKGELAAIQSASEVGGKLTERIVTWSRGAVNPPSLVLVEEHLRELQVVLRSLLPKNVNLLILPDAEGHVVEMDAVALDQVLLNLIANARDSGAGYVEIEITTVQVDSPRSVLGGLIPASRWSALIVRDDGRGIPASDLSRVLKRSFTTRREQGGSGLGLDTVVRQARRSGGYFDLTSSEGQGTTATVFFPAASGNEARALQEAHAVATQRLRSRGRVWICARHPILRNYVSRVVHGFGLDTRAFGEGESLLASLIIASRRPQVVLWSLQLGRQVPPALLAAEDVEVVVLSDRVSPLVDMEPSEGVPVEPRPLMEAIRGAFPRKGSTSSL